MPHLGIPELLIILFVVLLLFGAKRLPETFAGLGKGLRQFKEALTAPDAKDTPAAGGEKTKEATR